MGDALKIVRAVGDEEKRYIGVEGGIREYGSLRLATGFDLMRAIHESKATGVLTLRNRNKIKRICFKLGEPVDFRSNLSRELIGRHLVSEGVLTKAEVDRWISEFKNERPAGVRFGSYLVSRGVVTQESVNRALRLQQEFHLISLAGWSDGEFWFEKKDDVTSGGCVDGCVENVCEAIVYLFDASVGSERLASVSNQMASCRTLFVPPAEGQIENHSMWQVLWSIRSKQLNGYLQIDRRGRLLTVLFENGVAKVIQVLKGGRSMLLGAGFKGFEREFVSVLLSIVSFTSGTFRFAERQFGETDHEALARDAKARNDVIGDINISEVEESRVVVSPTFVKKIEDLQKSHIRKVSTMNLLFSSAREGSKVTANREQLERHFSRQKDDSDSRQPPGRG